MVHPQVYDFRDAVRNREFRVFIAMFRRMKAYANNFPEASLGRFTVGGMWTWLPRQAMIGALPPW